jgi:uncharacterized membrane protein (DUF485 family)
MQGGMMSKHHYAAIRGNHKFHELVSKRTKLSWTLTALILLVYYSFILVIAFYPGLFGIPVGKGNTITWGIVIGIGVILFTFVITGIYVHRANTEFDRLLYELVNEEKDGNDGAGA